jgi:hypothetical protein
MRILPLSALLLSLFAEGSRGSAKRDTGGRGQWPRPLSFRLHRAIPLIHRQFRVSNFIQIQNSRPAKVTTSRALSPIPPTPLAPDFVCVQKDPSPNAGVFFMRLSI